MNTMGFPVFSIFISPYILHSIPIYIIDSYFWTSLFYWFLWLVKHELIFKKINKSVDLAHLHLNCQNLLPSFLVHLESIIQIAVKSVFVEGKGFLKISYFAIIANHGSFPSSSTFHFVAYVWGNESFVCFVSLSTKYYDQIYTHFNLN